MAKLKSLDSLVESVKIEADCDDPKGIPIGYVYIGRDGRLFTDTSYFSNEYRVSMNLKFRRPIDVRSLADNLLKYMKLSMLGNYKLRRSKDNRRVFEYIDRSSRLRMDIAPDDNVSTETTGIVVTSDYIGAIELFTGYATEVLGAKKVMVKEKYGR